MDRNLLEREGYFLHELTQFRCPTCGKGKLTDREKKGGPWKGKITAEYRKVASEYDDPYEYRFHFAMVLSCTNMDCQEAVGVTGFSKGDSRFISIKVGGVTEQFFKPYFFFPPLHLIDIPPKTPDPVKSELVYAFSTFFFDPSASGNKIRIALERLLDTKKIRKTRLTRSRRRVRLSLFERINLLMPKLSPELGPLMHAIRKLGNQGSHDKLPKQLVLDAFEFMEFLLKELYDDTKTNILRKAAKIAKM